MPKLKNKWTGEIKEVPYDFSGQNEARELIATGAWEETDEMSAVSSLEIKTDIPKIELDTKLDTPGFGDMFKEDTFSVGQEFGLDNLKKISGFGDISVKKLGLNYGDEEEDESNFGF